MSFEERLSLRLWVIDIHVLSPFRRPPFTAARGEKEMQSDNAAGK
jgi:hypothetical protein